MFNGLSFAYNCIFFFLNKFDRWRNKEVNLISCRRLLEFGVVKLYNQLFKVFPVHGYRYLDTKPKLILFIIFAIYAIKSRQRL